MTEKQHKVSLNRSDWLKYLMVFGVAILIAVLCRPRIDETFDIGDLWENEDVVLNSDLVIQKEFHRIGSSSIPLSKSNHLYLQLIKSYQNFQKVLIPQVNSQN